MANDPPSYDHRMMIAQRFKAYQDDSNALGAARMHPQPPEREQFFLYGSLADAQTLQHLLDVVDPPILQPARILWHEISYASGSPALISAWWWRTDSRFPQPYAEGVVATIPRSAVPALLAHLGPDNFYEMKLQVTTDDKKFLCSTFLWNQSILDPGATPVESQRTLFFYGSLMDTDLLVKLLELHHPPDLRPAELKGWRIKMWGPYPALIPAPGWTEPVLGCVYECQGKHLPALERYEGETYRPQEVTVTLPSGETVTAWCFVWDDDLDELEEGSYTPKGAK